VPALPDRRCTMMMQIPFVDTVATGQNIDRLRLEAGMSVKDIQNVFGFATPQAIYKWIRGTAMPTIDNLVILAAILDVTMDDIIVTDTYEQKFG
jgi:transcriptional regulator with XRE-family HTH domain